MRILSWIIALCGLWEFGDIAALFVPDFGKIQPFVWNHIIVGLILMIVGAWAARTSNADMAKAMNWIAVFAGVWLIIGSFILQYPLITAGLWNDVIAGVIASVLGVSAGLKSRTGEE